MSSLPDAPFDGDTRELHFLGSATDNEPLTGLPVRHTTVRYFALAWLTAAAVLAYFCRNAIGVAESTIRGELALTLQQSGWFMGAFFWTYAIFQVPSGWFSERFGTRMALSVFTLGGSAAMCSATTIPSLERQLEFPSKN